MNVSERPPTPDVTSQKGTNMAWYAWASLFPAVLIALACLTGGPLAYAPVVAATLLVFGVDRVTRLRLRPRVDTRAQNCAQFLCVALGVVHFLLLALGVHALSGGTPLTLSEGIALFLALGIFFGQISNSNAHELIHSRNRFLYGLGVAIYVSLLFGHHVSAHLRVHHVWVATDRDPNSARLGEGFYRFWIRAWKGSFRAGLAAENRLRAQEANPLWRHPYTLYCVGALGTFLIALTYSGLAGALALVALAIYAQMQLLISDYVQHYGLRRTILATGKAEPVAVQHSWNAAPWYSGAMMLNAPRHSDHHLHPSRPFPALRMRRKLVPTLPSTFPLMGLVATIPPLWRRIMDPKVQKIHQEFSKTGMAAADLSELPDETLHFDSDPVSGHERVPEHVERGHGRG